MHYPRITIVTPNYNYGHFLEQAIVSVLDQQYPNLEYIIIDGGSSDNSVEIIRKYEKYLAYWVSEPDKGMYDAINKGFSRSTGEVMAWLNSDDAYFPWAFKVVGEVFGAFPQVEWISSLQPGAMDYKGYVVDLGRFEGFSREAFREGRLGLKNSYGFIQQESTFWKRELWEKAGAHVSTRYSMAGDFELWCRFYEHTQLYGIVSPLGIFRFQHRQKSADTNLYTAQCKEVFQSFKYSKSLFYTLRNAVSFARMNRIPGIMHLTRKWLGYNAESLVRANRELPDSIWQIKSTRFI
jgi:glycosyltransferase involved in cell wall biosynthesis